VLTAHKHGFEKAATALKIPSRSQKKLVLTLTAPVVSTPITAQRIVQQNRLTPSGASHYTLTSKDIANLPMGESTPLNHVMLQMPGVALDQNQEIHIRVQLQSPARYKIRACVARGPSIQNPISNSMAQSRLIFSHSSELSFR
jgi:hypothetical protein